MTSTDLLDTDELLHLALHASGRDDPGTAIEYLRRLLGQEPRHAMATYLLGAQQAQVGLYAHARESMARALQLQPDIDVARFQLGWLHLLQDDVAGAEETWAPFDALDEGHHYRAFKNALLHRARGELQACLDGLLVGIGANRENAPLNDEMSRLAERVKRELEGSTGAPVATARETEVPSMYLAAYTDRKP